MSNIDAFIKELERDEKKLLERVDEVVKDVTVELITSLLNPKTEGGTPKITGFLRNNWNISINSEDPEVRGSKEDPLPALSKQQSSIDEFLDTNIIKINTLWVNNSVPYGPLVNYGDASYRYRGFRERAILKANVYLRGVKL